MPDLKLFKCRNVISYEAQSKVATCLIMAEDKTDAIEHARDERPDFPEHNWEVDEIEMTGAPQLLYTSIDTH